MPNENGKSSNKKIINQSYGDAQHRASSRNEINRKLRRICREECEMLENELCRKEYAIAKRHPLIGQQVPLVECSDLPLDGTTEARDCLTLGLSAANNVQESTHILVLYSFDFKHKYITKLIPLFLQMTIAIGVVENPIEEP